MSLRIFAEMPKGKRSENVMSYQFKSSSNLKFERRVQTPLPTSKMPLEYEKGNWAMMDLTLALPQCAQCPMQAHCILLHSPPTV
jgi:adenine-specific DNA glycosylase